MTKTVHGTVRGKFIELETIVDDDERETGQAAVRGLAERLGLKNGERRSYLELVLQQSGHD